MKKLLFLIATTALLCSCDKITIEENDVADTYWAKRSEYVEYIRDGEKVSYDTEEVILTGGGSLMWHFKDHSDIVVYSSSCYPISSFYSTTDYDINLKKKRLYIGSTTYKIRKFTDNELIVEREGLVNTDPNGLQGYRFVKTKPLSEKALLEYVPAVEEPTDNTYWHRIACYYNYTENGETKIKELHFSATNDYGQEYWLFKNDKELVCYTEKAGVPPYYQDWSCEVDLANNKLATIDNKGERVEYTIIYEFTQRELLIEHPATINGDPNGRYRLLYQRINPDKYKLGTFIPYEELPDEYKNPSN